MMVHHHLLCSGHHCIIRVAKCHGYDGYIRVKIFAGWGKKSGRRCNLAKFSLFLGRFAPLYKIYVYILA